MSIKAYNWVWQDSPRSITANDLVVLMALADVANDEGVVTYLGAADSTQIGLAKKARVSRRTFQRSIDRLEGLGVLVVGHGNQFNASTYEIRMRQYDATNDSSVASTATSESVTGGAFSPATPSIERITFFNDEKSEKSKTVRASRIPADFAVDEAMVSWALWKCPAVDVGLETEKFVDYWSSSSGRNAVKRDWVAAWRNWLRMGQQRAVEHGWKPDLVAAEVVSRSARDAEKAAFFADAGITEEEWGSGSVAWRDEVVARVEAKRMAS